VGRSLSSVDDGTGDKSRQGGAPNRHGTVGNL